MTFETRVIRPTSSFGSGLRDLCIIPTLRIRRPVNPSLDPSLFDVHLDVLMSMPPIVAAHTHIAPTTFTHPGTHLLRRTSYTPTNSFSLTLYFVSGIFIQHLSPLLHALPRPWLRSSSFRPIRSERSDSKKKKKVITRENTLLVGSS